jgi:hypothetical protein
MALFPRELACFFSSSRPSSLVCRDAEHVLKFVCCALLKLDRLLCVIKTSAGLSNQNSLETVDVSCNEDVDSDRSRVCSLPSAVSVVFPHLTQGRVHS